MALNVRLSIRDDNFVRSGWPGVDVFYMWTFLFFKTNHNFNLFINTETPEIGLVAGRTLLLNLLCFQQ